MKTDTMRNIDRYVGIPLCIVLSWLAPLFARRSRSNVVVVCKFFGIGSICLSYPLIYELKKQGKDVVYLSFASNEAMVGFLGVERCLTISPKSFWTFCFGVFKVIWQLRQIRPAGFLNLEFFSQFAAIMSVLSGAPVRSGFYMLHSTIGRLYTHRTNLNVYHSITENYLNMGVLAGLITAPETPDSYPDTFQVPDSVKLPAAMTENIMGDFIVINVESSETIHELKSWSSENWASLINRLREEHPEHQIILIGVNPDEVQHGEIASLLQDVPEVINFIGRTSFNEFTGLLAHAMLVITVDSGPLHLSALLKRPTIALFGPETPTLYGHQLPWVRCFYKNLMCSPCLAIYDAKESVLDCQNNRCMKQITTDEVLQAALEMLPAVRGAPRQRG